MSGLLCMSFALLAGSSTPPVTEGMDRPLEATSPGEGVPLSASNTPAVLPRAMTFETNIGQFPSDVLMGSSWAGPAVDVLADGMRFWPSGMEPQTNGEPIEIRFLGPAQHASVAGERAQPGHVAYLHGGSTAAKAPSSERFAQVVIRNLYPGIDLVLRGGDTVPEFDLVAREGASACAIRFEILGADALALDSSGDILLTTSAGRLRQSRPRAFQQRGAQKVEIPAAYEILADGSIGFEFGAHDPGIPLIIDPSLTPIPVPNWRVTDIAADGRGFVYAYGELVDPPRPTTGYGAPILYVAKIEAATGRLAYWVYIGGSDNTVSSVPGGIVAGPDGSAFIVGNTNSKTFPVVRPAQSSLAGEGYSDAFVAQIDPTGTSLLFSTYLGGSHHEDGTAIGLDGAGNVFVLGRTSSPDFPVTPGAWDITCGTDGRCNPDILGTVGCDLFVAKLDPVQGDLVWATYLGGRSLEFPAAIAADAYGCPVVAGSSYSFDYPTTVGAYDRLCGDAAANCSPSNSYPTRDAVVTKLKADGSGLVWSTFFGGAGEDQALDLTLDATGSVVTTGTTLSTTLPNDGGFQSKPGSGFLAKLAADGGSLRFASYLGSQTAPNTYQPVVRDWCRHVEVDSANRIWISGETYSGSLPMVNPLRSFSRYWIQGGTGYADGFLAQVGPDGGSPLFSTLIGGTGDGLARGPGGDVIAVGATSAVNAIGVLRLHDGGELADLDVEAWQEPSSTRHGLPVEYVVRVHNSGPLDATGVALWLSWPLSEYPVPNQGQCSVFAAPGLQAICSLGSIPVNGTATVRTPRIASSSDPVMRAAVESWVGDPNPENNKCTLTPAIAPLPTLRLTAEPVPSIVSAGEGIPVVLRLVNLGPSEAYDTTLAISASLSPEPPGATTPWDAELGDVASGSARCTDASSGSNTAVQCRVGTLAPESEATVTLTARGVVPGKLRLSAEARYDWPGSPTEEEMWATSLDVVSPFGPGYTWFVAGVAHNPGANGTQWRSDLAIINPGTATATVAVTFVAEQSEQDRSAEILPGHAASWHNVLETLFGVVPGQAVAGSLRITASAPLAILARTYNDTPEGTFGQEYPAIPLGSGRSRTQPPATIPQLRKNPGFRTNLGAVNLSSFPGVLSIVLHRADGSPIGSPVLLEVPASGWAQQFDPLAGAGRVDVAFATTAVETPGVKLWPYASLVDAITGDPTTLTADSLGQSGWGMLALSSIATHTLGVNQTKWRTDVAIANTEPRDLDLTFYYRSVNSVRQRDVRVPFGEAREWRDILLSLFEMPSSTNETGVLSIGSPTAGNGVASGFMTRIYSETPNGTYGQGFPFFGFTAMPSSGQLAVLPMLRKSDLFRTNVGFVAYWAKSAEPVDVRFTLRDADGSVLGSPQIFSLPLGTVVQKNDVFAFAGAPARETAYGTVEILTTDARVFMYGSVIDNRTGDPTTVLPVVFPIRASQ